MFCVQAVEPSLDRTSSAQSLMKVKLLLIIMAAEQFLMLNYFIKTGSAVDNR